MARELKWEGISSFVGYIFLRTNLTIQKTLLPFVQIRKPWVISSSIPSGYQRVNKKKHQVRRLGHLFMKEKQPGISSHRRDWQRVVPGEDSFIMPFCLYLEISVHNQHSFRPCVPVALFRTRITSVSQWDTLHSSALVQLLQQTNKSVLQSKNMPQGEVRRLCQQELVLLEDEESYMGV